MQQFLPLIEHLQHVPDTESQSKKVAEVGLLAPEPWAASQTEREFKFSPCPQSAPNPFGAETALEASLGASRRL